ncbi:MAG: hypothetical protein LBT35_02280 [Tannerella sp.]|jgi:F0F1-type ATP synthase epsilon subunit|nr:hypothetical protein [Tannerella sp.]
MIEMKILSPTGTIFDGAVAHATFPGEAGSFAVYSLHAPLISTLKRGEIVYFPARARANAATSATAPASTTATTTTTVSATATAFEAQSIAIESGFVEMLNNILTVCIEQPKQLQP